MQPAKPLPVNPKVRLSTLGKEPISGEHMDAPRDSTKTYLKAILKTKTYLKAISPICMLFLRCESYF